MVEASRRCQPILPSYGKYYAMSPGRLTFNQLDDNVAAGRIQRVGSVHHRDISPISDTEFDAIKAHLATAATAKPLPVSVTTPFPTHMKDTLRIKGFACQLSGTRAASPGALPTPVPIRAGSRNDISNFPYDSHKSGRHIDVVARDYQCGNPANPVWRIRLDGGDHSKPAALSTA